MIEQLRAVLTNVTFPVGTARPALSVDWDLRFHAGWDLALPGGCAINTSLASSYCEQGTFLLVRTEGILVDGTDPTWGNHGTGRVHAFAGPNPAGAGVVNQSNGPCGLCPPGYANVSGGPLRANPLFDVPVRDRFDLGGGNRPIQGDRYVLIVVLTIRFDAWAQTGQAGPIGAGRTTIRFDSAGPGLGLRLTGIRIS